MSEKVRRIIRNNRLSRSLFVAIFAVFVGISENSATASAWDNVVGGPVESTNPCSADGCENFTIIGNPISSTVLTSTATGGSKTKTETATSVRTKTETASSPRTRTETSTGGESTASSTRQSKETAEAGVSRLYNIGNGALYSGAEKIAIGITLLSQSRAKNTEDSETDSQEALKLIGSGNQDMATGQASIRQAQAVEENTRRLGAVDGAPARVSRPPLDLNHAPSSTQDSLARMEKETDVSSSALVAAVAEGNTDAIYDLAASAKGVDMSSAELAAGIPIYKVSSMPSVPSPDPQAAKVAALVPAPATEKEKNTRLNPATTSSEVKHNLTQASAPSADPLAPLERDQFLSSINGGSKGNAALGSANVSLFQRVRAQYKKRRL